MSGIEDLTMNVFNARKQCFQTVGQVGMMNRHRSAQDVEFFSFLSE